MKKIKITIASLALLTTISANAQQTVGLFTETGNSLDGYVLFAPIQSDTTYLIDKCGKKIHEWASPKKPGLSVYLLPDGSLVRTEVQPNVTFNGAGAAGGIIAKYDWNGSLLWSDTISSNTETQNHDVCPLPNGNIIAAVWVNYTSAQAIAAGRNPAQTGASLWSAQLIEIQPSGTSGGTIVWQWNLFDHLIQDYDSTKINYGVVANHPELMNLNFIGTDSATQVDWTHLNAVTYNETLDQIMFSFHNLSEIYIIDHSTTTPEAASHAGGTHNKGGDFLYRWGNPQAYNRGTVTDRKLYLQHNPNWIPAGYPGENNIMIFNNGVGRPGGNASSVDIIAPPVDANGDYMLTSGQAYGPSAANYSYMNSVPSNFFSLNMGSSQRLVNGNTIVCEATKGNFFEIDSSGTTVWDYINPVGNAGPVAQGTTITTNTTFRCIYYPTNYSGFNGHTLTPGNPIELNPLPYSCSLTLGIDGLAANATANVKVINPFKDKLIINSNTDLFNTSATLMDVTGRIVYQNNINLSADNFTEIPLGRDLSAGIYFLNLKSSDKTITVKLVQQ